MLCLITVVGKEDEKVRVGFTVIIVLVMDVSWLCYVNYIMLVRPNLGAVTLLFDPIR